VLHKLRFIDYGLQRCRGPVTSPKIRNYKKKALQHGTESYSLVWVSTMCVKGHQHTVKALFSPLGAYLILGLMNGGLFRERDLIERGRGGDYFKSLNN